MDTTGLTESQITLLESMVVALTNALREANQQGEAWAERDAEKTARLMDMLDGEDDDAGL